MALLQSVTVLLRPGDHQTELLVSRSSPASGGTQASVKPGSAWDRAAITRAPVDLARPSILTATKPDHNRHHLGKRSSTLPYVGGQLRCLPCRAVMTAGVSGMPQLRHMLRAQGVEGLRRNALTRCVPVGPALEVPRTVSQKTTLTVEIITSARE